MKYSISNISRPAQPGNRRIYTRIDTSNISNDIRPVVVHDHSMTNHSDTTIKFWPGTGHAPSLNVTLEAGVGTSTNDSRRVSHERSRSTNIDILNLTANEVETAVMNYTKALPAVLDDDALENIKVNRVNSILRVRT